MDLPGAQRRLGLLHDWAAEMYAASGEDRGAIHQREFAAGDSSVLAAVELAISDWSPWAARIASGRPLKTMVGFRVSLLASLFDRPEVAAFLAAEEGSVQFRRYLEIVEMLRLALLQYADAIEGTGDR